jgi:hypothetical protein
MHKGDGTAELLGLAGASGPECAIARLPHHFGGHLNRAADHRACLATAAHGWPRPTHGWPRRAHGWPRPAHGWDDPRSPGRFTWRGRRTGQLNAALVHPRNTNAQARTMLRPRTVCARRHRIIGYEEAVLGKDR